MPAPAHRHPRNRATLVALGVSLFAACFAGEFVAGLPCSDDADCGPELACIDGHCGGRGQHAVCGNWLLEDGEQCDDGNTRSDDMCTPECQHAVCGDGYLAPGEQCDDGDTVDDPLCDASCRVPDPPGVCGDARRDPGEECDDGNDIDTDACTTDCKLQICGDYHVGPGEQCDDGNDIDTDACLSTCVLASCGDGVVGPGESCDDANADETDGCTSLCHPPACFDGLRSGDESDVDCGGSCPQCPIGGSCQLASDCAGELCEDGVCRELALQVAVGEAHSCALLNTGVRCWGHGGSGRLGYQGLDVIGDNETPASVGLVDVGGTVTALALGSFHTCALLDTGEVRCWGQGAGGRLGYASIENIGDDESPASAGSVDVGGTVVQLSAGRSHTCAVLDNGELRCWGSEHGGALGPGVDQNIGDDETPASVPPVVLADPVRRVVAGNLNTCALLQGQGMQGGDVSCWGNVLSSFYAGPAQQLALNVWSYVCRVLDDGQLSCGGNPAAPLLPIGIVPINEVVEQVALGRRHACVLLQTGAVRCYGEHDKGQLGHGILGLGDVAVEDATDLQIGGAVVQLAIGNSGDHTCALMQGGTVRCWGWGQYGQLGYGNNEDVGDDETPAYVGDVPCLAN